MLEEDDGFVCGKNSHNLFRLEYFVDWKARITKLLYYPPFVMSLEVNSG